MTLTEMKEELGRDVDIDVTNLQTAAHRLPILTAKWLNIRAQCKTQVTKAEERYVDTRRNQFLYYIGKHPDYVCDVVYEKSEIKIIMEGDDQVRKAEMIVAHAKNAQSFADDAVKTIREMGFTIKNIIDLRKLEAGIV